MRCLLILTFLLSLRAVAADESSIDRAIEFEKIVTPLLSLGDNMEHISEIKEKVLGWSAAFGMTLQEAADFGVRLHKETRNMDASTARDLETQALSMMQFGGGPGEKYVTALGAYWRAYGGTLASMTVASNRLYLASEKTPYTLDEFVAFVPEIMQLAADAGMTDSEALAMFVVMSRTDPAELVSAPPPPPPPPPFPYAGVLKNGMLYGSVVDIIGVEGELTSHEIIGEGSIADSFTWDLASGEFTAFFIDGKLTKWETPLGTTIAPTAQPENAASALPPVEEPDTIVEVTRSEDGGVSVKARGNARAEPLYEWNMPTTPYQQHIDIREPIRTPPPVPPSNTMPTLEESLNYSAPTTTLPSSTIRTTTIRK